MYMRQWTGSAFVRVMACHLFGAKPLPEPMLASCQLDSWEQISVKFELEFYHFHSRKYVWICCLPKWRPFCPGGGELVGSCWLVYYFGAPSSLSSHCNSLGDWAPIDEIYGYPIFWGVAETLIEIDVKSALVQVMAWFWVGIKPLPDQWWPKPLRRYDIARPQ